MKRRREHFFRYILIGSFYIVVCLIFIARLINIQIAGQDYYQESYSDGYRRRTVTIQALRGEIYDKNGKLLVSNEYTYSLYLESGSFPYQNDDKNALLL